MRLEAKKTYIVDTDAFQQIIDFAKYSTAEKDLDNALIVAIGSEVISEDDEEREFVGYAEDDAYSCLGNVMNTKNIDNNVQKSHHNVAFISLSNAAAIFPELHNIPPFDLTGRAIIARFIAANVAHFLAGRLFAEDLNRDHNALCVAEANWIGGARAAYKARGLCKICRDQAQRIGIAKQYVRHFNWESATNAIDALSNISEKIENGARAFHKYRYLIDLSVIVLAASLIINLLSNYNAKTDYLTDYIVDHWPAAVAAGIAIFSALYLVVKMKFQTRLVP